MANVKISQLASAAALTGSEEVAIVQSNATVKTTTQDIANLAGGGSQTLEILSDGTIATQYTSVRYSTSGVITNQSGNQSVQIATFPEIYLGGGTATYITLPTLTSTAISVSGFGSLVTVSFPELVSISTTGMTAFSINGCPSLTTINIPVLATLPNNSPFQFNNNALSEATVDDILVKFAATTAQGCTLYLDGGSNAAPSPAGQAARGVLQLRNWTVITN